MFELGDVMQCSRCLRATRFGLYQREYTGTYGRKWRHIDDGSDRCANSSLFPATIEMLLEFVTYGRQEEAEEVLAKQMESWSLRWKGFVLGEDSLPLRRKVRERLYPIELSSGVLYEPVEHTCYYNGHLHLGTPRCGDRGVLVHSCGGCGRAIDWPGFDYDDYKHVVDGSTMCYGQDIFPPTLEMIMRYNAGGDEELARQYLKEIKACYRKKKKKKNNKK